MGVNIRPLNPSDRSGVEQMLLASPAFSAEETRVAIEMIDLGLTDGPERGYPLFVAEMDRTICGYICIGPTPLTQSTWHVYWICVHPTRQGRGVGSALQAHVEQYVRSHHGRRLVVETSGRPDYQRSRGFYAARGYQVVGRIADYYRPGDDCLFYCKVLS
jgi:ribosomal protein S18 acetylase RimI-like enzyme